MLLRRGAARYVAEGEPVLKAQCHCRACQHFSGGAPNLFMLMPAEGFTYTKGAPKAYTRPDKVDAVTREFCAACGTHMISRRLGLRLVVLKIGTLDNPSVYGGAQMAIFTAEGQPFHLIADGIPAFEGLPPRRCSPLRRIRPLQSSKCWRWRAATAMKKATTTMKKQSGSAPGKGAESPSRLIDARIKKLSDWRGATLARVRALIKEACPEVVEEVKWRKPSNPLGVPVWGRAGIVCTGETYKDKVKLTFAKGAALKDASGLFNSSLEGSVRRAIDVHEGDKIDDKALKALIRAAVALNTSAAQRKR